MHTIRIIIKAMFSGQSFLTFDVTRYAFNPSIRYANHFQVIIFHKSISPTIYS